MKTGTKGFLLAGTHAVALAIGFAGGIYTLPILIAPPPPSAAEVQVAARAFFSNSIRRRFVCIGRWVREQIDNS